MEAELAPGVPPDYYRSIADVEESHWWHRGMLAITAGLLGSRLEEGGRALDAGCGTGGFIRFLQENGWFASVAGTDIASAAVELARARVPEADLHVAPMNRLPFADRAFDLVVTNDVLQHVPERDLESSLHELRRVLAPGGALLVRTNGSRKLRREREDWRAYDRGTLRRDLMEAGLAVERATYANFLFSLAAALRGRSPHAPSAERHGIPSPPARLANSIGRRALQAEAWWVGRGGSLPYGHTLFALATASSS